MKKLLGLTLITMLIFASAGCKKGENDPFSLLTRKARITGVWNLTSADYKTVDIDDGTTETKNYAYDGTKLTVTVDGEGETIDYSELLTIEKDGTFKMVIDQATEYFDSGSFEWKTGISTETTEGVWYFLEGNDNLDVKNKERVEFLTENYKRVEPDGDTYEYSMSGKTNTFVTIILLNRLANDEIISSFDYTQTHGDDSYSKTGTMTYSKQ